MKFRNERLAIELSTEMDQQLTARAQRLGISRAQFVRMVIEQFLDRAPSPRAIVGARCQLEASGDLTGDPLMRLNYTDEEEYSGQFSLWQANCRRSMKGKAGQAALRRLEAALMAMPEPRLIRGRLSNSQGEVCAIGALARADGKLPPPEPFDDEDDLDDTAEFATFALGVPHLVAWEVVAHNDLHLDTVWERALGPIQRGHGQYQGGVALIRDMTPEERYDAMLTWIRAQLAITVTQS